MINCLLQQRHTGAAVALWQRVFGDEPQFIKQCIDEFAKNGFVMTMLDGDVVAAILLAAPCSYGARKGVYLYALATAPELRGAGVMSRLMRAAELEAAGGNAAFAVLIPAGESLFSYYEKRGYSNRLCLRHLELPVKPEVAGALALTTSYPPCAHQIDKLRKKLLGAEPVIFSPPQSSMVEEDMAQAGFLLEEAEQGYAIVLKRGVHLLVAELAASSDEAALALVGAAAQRAGCDRAFATLPEQSSLFPGCGVGQPFALAKPLVEGVDLTDGYLRFALDVPVDSFVLLDKML